MIPNFSLFSPELYAGLQSLTQDIQPPKTEIKIAPFSSADNPFISFISLDPKNMKKNMV